MQPPPTHTGAPIRYKRRNESKWRSASPPSPRPPWTEYGKLKGPGKPSHLLYLISHSLHSLHTTLSLSIPSLLSVKSLLSSWQGVRITTTFVARKTVNLFTQQRTPEPGFYFHHQERKKCLKKSMLYTDGCGRVISNHSHWGDIIYLWWRLWTINNFIML